MSLSIGTAAYLQNEKYSERHSRTAQQLSTENLPSTIIVRVAKSSDIHFCIVILRFQLELATTSSIFNNARRDAEDSSSLWRLRFIRRLRALD